MTILKFVDKYGRFRWICCTHLEVFIYPENVGRSFLRNLGTYLLNKLYTRRHKTGLHTDHHVNFIFHEMQEPSCFKNIFFASRTLARDLHLSNNEWIYQTVWRVEYPYRLKNDVYINYIQIFGLYMLLHYHIHKHFKVCLRRHDLMNRVTELFQIYSYIAFVLAFMEISFVFINSFSKHFSKQKS